jgi:outer membrane receptor for ferrienterochelin and colicin
VAYLRRFPTHGRRNADVSAKCLGVFLFLLLFCGVCAFAQEFRGTILGTVMDGSGAVVPGAQVVATNVATQVQLQAVTTADGNYTIPFVLPGMYRIRVESDGFKAAIRDAVEIRVQERARVDFQLEPGVVSDSVTVAGEVPVLGTADASVGTVISQRQIAELPEAGRVSYLLARTAPGILPTDSRLFTRVFDNGAVSAISISGAPSRSNDVLLDGIPNTVADNTVAFVPTTEAVEEIKVQTNTYDAEFGRAAGGSLNVTVRSGTNNFHGSAFEYLRNDALEANSFFNNRSGLTKPRQRYNQFGVSAGGPIFIPKFYDGRNRTFVFGVWEGIRQSDPNQILSTVPTMRERDGDFSQSYLDANRLLTVYDPFSTRPNPDAAGRFLRTPFANNIIPRAMQDPVARSLMSYYAEPNQPGAPFTSVENFAVTGSAPDNYDSLILRFDHNFTDRQRVFVRTSKSERRAGDLNIFNNVATYGGFGLRTSLGGAVDYLNTLTNNTVLNVRYGLTRYGNDSEEMDFSIADLGMPQGLAASVDNAHFPVISLSGYQGIGNAGDSVTRRNTHSFQVNMTRIGSRNNLKWGFDYRVYQENLRTNGNASGTYSFNQAFTRGPDPVASPNSGHSVASFLLGTPASASIDKNVHPAFSNSFYGAFLQSDLRMTRTVTINLGIRYEFEGPRTERHNRLVRGFAYDTPSPLQIPDRQLLGGLQFAGVDGESRYQWNPRYHNFAPRAGLAWQIHPRLVFRTGYGVFLAGLSNIGGGTDASAGFGATTAMVTSLDGVTPLNRLSDPFPEGLLTPIGASQGLLTFVGQSVSFMDVGSRLPYTQQYSAGFQFEPVNRLLLEASYSGSRGSALSIGNVNINQLTEEQMQLGGLLQQSVENPFFGLIDTGILSGRTTTVGQLLRPYPQFNAVTMRNPTIGNSTYHAALIKAERRFASGWTFTASYTVQKLIDDNGSPQNNYYIAGERAISTLDRSQRLMLSGVYELPFGPGKALTGGSNGVVHRLIEGWQLNWVTTFMSGQTLAVTSNVNTTGSLGGSQRPDSTGKSAALSGSNHERLERYFDTSQFVHAQPFTFGNVSRRLPDVRGPGLQNWDVSLIKNTQLAESIRLQFRAEAFNAWNTPAFGMPNTSFGNAAFGRISDVADRAQPARQLMLGLKLLW